MRRRVLPTLLCTLVLAACGTTVRTASTGSLQAGSGELGSSTGTANGTVANTQTGTVTSTTPNAVEGTNGSTTTGTADTTVAAPQGAIPTAAPGHQSVPVGIAYSSDVQQFGGALGGNLDTGDEKAEASAVVSWINGHGGLAGHPINPIYFDVHLTDPTPYDQMAQTMCSSWTQDAHVVAGIFVAVNAPTTIAQCLSNHHIPYFENGWLIHDSTDFRTWQTMVDAAELEGYSGARTLIESLWQQHFLTARDQIGAVTMDYPAAKRTYDNALVPQLASHGLHVAVRYEIKTPTSTPGIGASASDVQSAVLKMRSTGVTKVLFLCYGCGSFFMQDAESQHWRPAYGLSSWDMPWYLAGAAPAGQLTGAHGVGWQPLNDVPLQGAPTPSANAVLCDRILRPTGQIPRQFPQVVAFNYCDALLTLRAAAQGLPAVTSAALLHAVDGLGRSYQSALGMHTTFRPAQHWGADEVRPFEFAPACTCFHYTGAAQPAVTG